MNPSVVSSLLVRRSLGSVTGMRCMASGSPPPWNYLWKPGPYADTEEKRIAAAKKYGMLIEDYKQYDPVTEADVMAGDYPKLPIEPMNERDPLYHWDFPEYRRNYGEPLQEEHNLYHETRYSPMNNARYTKAQMFATQIALGLTIYVLYTLCNGDYWIPRMSRPVMGEQYINDGKTWYTFEVPKEE